MKKLATFTLALLLILCLCACQGIENPFAFRFPQDSFVLGVDVSGSTKEEAWALVENAAANYTLNVTVEGTSVSLTAQDMGLGCSQDAFLADAAASDGDFSDVIRYDEEALKEKLDSAFNTTVADAAICFDEATGQFLVTPHRIGMKTDIDALAQQVSGAIRTLTPNCTLTGVGEVILPKYTADADQVQDALALVNKMTGIELAYTFGSFTPDTLLEITPETLRSFVDLGEDGFSPAIRQDAVQVYAAQLAQTYSTEDHTGSFRTTDGNTIDFEVEFTGCQVDTAALAQDMITCMQDGISETRKAPYLDGGVPDMPYNGNYLEVNLDQQRLWYYKDGECLVDTDLVSGKVAANMCTPTGVFQIKYKTRSTYLVGEDYRSYVNYWMPFYRGYGLHDATWRKDFGGDIYLYDGSHGCVNLPRDAASTIFQNAPSGTSVIVFGGAHDLTASRQKLSGTTSYQIADDCTSFRLDLQPEYATKLTYSSDNPDVVTVAEDGTVTITGLGTANIEVRAAAFDGVTSAKASVSVKVYSACEDGRHVLDTVILTAPTCQPGLQRSTCSKCDYTAEETLAPVQAHTRGSWEIVTPATCTETGVRHRCCTQCGEELESQQIKVKAHSFDDGVACSVCGANNPESAS